MENFIVSARKYRPETFRSVVGQNHITSTLKNAIGSNYLGHAYLFCGPRGVGKTTCARIFAKSINCSQLSSDIEPCNVCESCLAFNESRSYNIHELDAASNNSVEDIRSLTDQVRIRPQIGKYSVYIIDEVHMLSQQAFNAFLKTLEEPPAHAVFILATTEKHKIIPTILSRCQIFDFNRIRIEDVVNYLKFIAGEEEINYETEAFHIIARKADGAMRDALTIFDQVVSFGGRNITYQDVIDNLNVLDYEYYFKLTDNFLSCNYEKTLLIFDEILNDGFDAHNFINGLAGHLRDLLVAGNPETVKLLDISDNIKEKYLKQSARCSPGFLFQALQICSETDQNFKSSRNQRLLVELALVKLANLCTEKKKPDQSLVDKTEIDSAQVETAWNNSKNTSGNKSEIKSHVQIKTDSEIDLKKNMVKDLSISIKNIIADEKNEENEHLAEAVDNQANEEEGYVVEENPFSQEELINTWMDFAGKLQNDRPRIYSMLKSHIPRQGDGYIINLILDNSSQLEEFNKNVKNELIAYLIKELKNSLITIIPILETKGNGKKMIYTTEERFQYLSKRNPALGRLKQEFNLDFE